jgi:hypothetical protein
MKIFDNKNKKKLFEKKLLNYDSLKLLGIPLCIKGKWFYDYSNELPDYAYGTIIQQVYKIYK